jgi:hypothetical protein
MNEKFPKIPKTYNCDACGIETSNKKDYNKHLLTSKHKNRTNGGDLEQSKFICKKCNKIYKARNSLWYHEKICVNESEETDEIPPIIKMNDDESIKILTNLVLEIVKNNSELQKQTNELQKQNQELNKQVLDVCQKIQPANNINNNNINSHNKTFNLNFFLNEQCKDAMNIMDFVNTFKLDFSDFERIGEVGYVEGISNIVIDKLNEMDVYKRPIHCSDAKREIMYVKDKDVWEKENANNDKIRLALKHITKKNTDLIRPWAIAHPGVLNSDHRLSDKYQEMIIEAMGGNKKNKNMKEGEDKIIKKISKMVLIDKNYVKNE